MCAPDTCVLYIELHYTLGAIVIASALFTFISIGRVIRTLIIRAQRSLFFYMIAHACGIAVQITGFIHFSYPDSVPFQAIRYLLLWGLMVSLWFALLFRFITIFETIEDTKQITAHLEKMKPALYAISAVYSVVITVFWLILPWTPRALQNPYTQNFFFKMGFITFACFSLLMLVCLIVSFLRLRQIMQSLVDLGESKAQDIKKLKERLHTQKIANMRSFFSISISIVFAVLASVYGFIYILVHLTMIGGTMGTLNTLKMFRGFKIKETRHTHSNKGGVSKKAISSKPESTRSSHALSLSGDQLNPHLALSGADPSSSSARDHSGSAANKKTGRYISANPISISTIDTSLNVSNIDLTGKTTVTVSDPTAQPIQSSPDITLGISTNSQ